jgi:outer membrane protein assembly factor BamB/predicted Ser/Thr protein kinase
MTGATPEPRPPNPANEGGPAPERADPALEKTLPGVPPAIREAQREGSGLDATRLMPGGAGPAPLSTARFGSPYARTRTFDAAGGETQAPPRFGKYLLLEELARGGMGVVFRARQADADRVVALKVLLAGNFASEEDELRFIREAELAAQLSHPNIVAVHDIGRVEGRRFFTMDLVEGLPLDRWARGKPREERLRAMVKACRAVHYAHMRGIIHRDLKPGNILVTDEGEPKILDFGLAKAAQAGNSTLRTVTGQTLGTPHYMAPEQAAGHANDVDIRTDVWSLGVLIHELVAGERPFPGSELMDVLARIQHDDPRPLDAPAELRLIAGKALEKDRARRYPTAEALADDIERFLAGEPVSVRAPGLARLARRWAKRHPAAAGAAVAVASILGTALLWQLTRPGRLQVSVFTPGATIEIDGAPAGSDASVPAGRHLIRVAAPDHETKMQEVFVGRGEARAIAVALDRSTGALDLEADEEGATVRVGEVVHGLPLRNHLVPTGEHRVVFQARGFESRERVLTVRRNRRTSAWVSLPSATYRYMRFGNTFAGPIALRDADGDGALDVSMVSEQWFFSMNGRTGERQRQAMLSPVVCTARWSLAHWDADGVPDDVLLLRYEGRLLARVASGREIDPAAPARDAPVPKLLWTKEWQAPSAGSDWDVAAPLGDELWSPVEGAIERVALGGGEVRGRVELGGAGPPQIRAAADGGALFVAAGRTLARFEKDGLEAWRVERGGPVRIVDERHSPARPGSRPIVCLDGGAFGVRPLDGSVAWEAPLASSVSLIHLPEGCGPAATEWYEYAGPVRVHDVDTGRHLCDAPCGDVLTFAGAPGFCFSVRDRDIRCTDARTGLELWRRTLPTRPHGFPACALLPDGSPEYALALEDRRLVSFDRDGRLTRDVALQFVPQRVHAAPLDADGRPDYVLTGFGVQAVRSSRVFWKRRGSNTMRPRPVIVSIGGEACVVEASRWEDGRAAMNCFRGGTGEIVWSVPELMDVMHEPALHDRNGDGVLDVYTQSGEPARFAVFDGKSGGEIARAPIPATPYPPALLRNLDADPDLEAVLFLWGKGLTAVKFAAEEPLWFSEAGTVFAPPLALDLDGDGREEAVAVHPSRGATDGKVSAWSLDGRCLWEADVPDRTWGPAFAADVDADGRPEIAVPAHTDVHVLARDGKQLARWKGLGGSIMGALPLPDGGFALGTREGCARVRRDGTAVWRWKGDRVGGALGLARLPGFSTPAVVGVDWSGRVFCLDAETGAERWRADLGSRSELGVTLADLDGDGVPEAVLGADDFTLYAVDLK